MNNIEVIKRFLNKQPGHTPTRITMNGYKEQTLKTDGLELINYSTRIAYHQNNKLYINILKYSKTTSKIQSQLKKLAYNYDIVEYEEEENFLLFLFTLIEICAIINMCYH